MLRGRTGRIVRVPLLLIPDANGAGAEFNEFTTTSAATPCRATSAIPAAGGRPFVAVLS